MIGVRAISDVEAWLQAAARLPDLLTASFDVFEAIRLAARKAVGGRPDLGPGDYWTIAVGCDRRSAQITVSDDKRLAHAGLIIQNADY